MKHEIVNYISLTERAKTQIKTLLAEKTGQSNGEKPLGIRLALKPKGCSGMKYSIEYAEKENISKYDDLFLEGDISIFIEPKISMWVVGTEMDYEDDGINAGFIFKNPNEKGQCGCGESFYV
jgi:iron-sulfur cluster assembly protein